MHWLRGLPLWALCALGIVVAALTQFGLAYGFKLLGVVADPQAGHVAALSNTLAVVLLYVQWVVTATPRGILAWHALRGGSKSVKAELSIEFEAVPGVTPEAVVERVKAWDPSNRVRSSDSKEICGMWIETSRLGPVRFECSEVSGPLDDGDGSLYVVCPFPPLRARDLNRLIRRDVETLMDALETLFGSPGGFQLKLEFDAAENPFYGALLRSDAANIGVSKLRLEPTVPYGGAGDHVVITEDTIDVSSRSRGAFGRMVHDFVGLKPLGS